jgi:hypothetical protein
MVILDKEGAMPLVVRGMPDGSIRVRSGDGPELELSPPSAEMNVGGGAGEGAAPGSGLQPIPAGNDGTGVPSVSGKKSKRRPVINIPGIIIIGVVIKEGEVESVSQTGGVSERTGVSQDMISDSFSNLGKIGYFGSENSIVDVYGAINEIRNMYGINNLEINVKFEDK